MTYVYTRNLTQKIQIAKGSKALNFEKWLIALFMRSSRLFFQRMPFTSPEMSKMGRNVVMQELVLHGNAVLKRNEEPKNLTEPFKW